MPPRWTHLISRSARTFLAYAYLLSAHNPKAQLGTHNLEVQLAVPTEEHAPAHHKASGLQTSAFHAQKHAHILNKSMPPRCTQLKIATRGEYRGARIWVLQSAHWRVTRPSDERIPYPDTHGNPGKHAQVGALPGLHACQPLPALRRSKRTRPARSLHHACIPWCACIPSASCASLCMWSLLQWSGESVAISHGTIFDFGEIWGMVTFPKSYKKPYLTERKMDKERLRSRDREKKLENVLEFLFFFSRQNLVLQNQWASDLSTEHMNDFPLLPKTL